LDWEKIESLALCMKDIKELLLDKGYLWWSNA
jgi:hypothetical protein